MFKLDNQFLTSLGLGNLPVDEKNKLLQHIYETLEMRVGMRLAEKMTDAQLDEFESFIDRNDEPGALKWLESNFPNYKDVVSEELEKLRNEVGGAAPQILAAAAQAQAGAPQGLASPQQGEMPPQAQPMAQQPPMPPQQQYSQPPAPDPYAQQQPYSGQSYQPQPVQPDFPPQAPAAQPQPQAYDPSSQSSQFGQQPMQPMQPQPQPQQPAPSFGNGGQPAPYPSQGFQNLSDDMSQPQASPYSSADEPTQGPAAPDNQPLMPTPDQGMQQQPGFGQPPAADPYVDPYGNPPGQPPMPASPQPAPSFGQPQPFPPQPANPQQFTPPPPGYMPGQ